MRYVADLHIHTRYSRATSRDMNLETLAKTAKIKGVNLLGTGDITHPEWRKELREKLKPAGRGIFQYDGVDFILSGEVSNIYKKDGRLRKIHIVLLFPDFEKAERFSSRMAAFGSLTADGRPTFGLDVEKMTEILMEISEDIMIIPAHIWTPWFSLFGANSGFDSVEECFGKYADRVTALETGLSSDPPMNWRLSQLDRYVLVSNSDAHSPHRIAREANVFARKLDYYELKETLEKKDRETFLFTIEFYPEEGKYHYDGHRSCDVRLKPRESIKMGNICPVCGRPLTVGVLHRVEELADRPEGFVPEGAIPYRNLVPLEEIIAEALGTGVETKSVKAEYEKLTRAFENELNVLLDVERVELEKVTAPRIAEGIIRAREGKLKIVPGYDGVYGIIKIFEEEPEKPQMSLF